jgi:hypothetical protein
MSAQTPKWTKNLSTVSWINSVAISDDGSRIVGGTFIHDYTNRSPVFGTYGTFAYDSAGNPLWADTYSGWDGVFAVGISGDGSVAAGGGISTRTKGLLKIFRGQTGAVLFDSTAAGSGGIRGRVSVLGLSGNGSVVAAAAGRLYVFVKSGTSYIPAVSSVPTGDPDFETELGTVAAVAVHPSGGWLAACNQLGQVLVATIASGKIKRTFLWNAPQEPVDPASAASPIAPVRFLSVTISAQSDSFVVGGSDVVYHGSLADIQIGNNPLRYDAWEAGAPSGSVIAGTPKPKPNVRWTAISGDGVTFAAVANRLGGSNGRGKLLIYTKGTFVPTATAELAHSPNAVSMDLAGQCIAVSDGYPPGNTATFYRFDATGNEIWHSPTPNMNWPVAVSADGSAIAGGGDDGYLYYLLP